MNNNEHAFNAALTKSLSFMQSTSFNYSVPTVTVAINTKIL